MKATTGRGNRRVDFQIIVLFLVFTLVCLTTCQPIQTPAPTLMQPPGATPTRAPSPAITPTPPPTPTSTPKPLPTVNVEVFPGDLQQTVREVAGGNFILWITQLDVPFDPVAKLNVETLHPSFVRLGMDLKNWEPTNDNEDPISQDGTGFMDRGPIHATFQAMQEFKKNGAVIVASAWNVPDWMVQNPTSQNARVIPREKYPEAIESIVAWLLTARDQYGVEVDYVSFNEPNIGVYVTLTPADAIELIGQAAPRFIEAGLKTKWLLGDCANMAGCLDYVEPIWKEESIRSYLGPLAFHSWDAFVEDYQVVHLTNISAQPQPLKITGLPGGKYDLRRSSENEVDGLIQTITVTNGTIEIVLAPSSVNFIITNHDD